MLGPKGPSRAPFIIKMLAYIPGQTDVTPPRHCCRLQPLFILFSSRFMSKPCEHLSNTCPTRVTSPYGLDTYIIAKIIWHFCYSFPLSFSFYLSQFFFNPFSFFSYSFFQSFFIIFSYFFSLVMFRSFSSPLFRFPTFHQLH